MDKEIKNLEDMGTFLVVKDDPWTKKLDSTWVITRKEVTDGKGTGAVKARLCVRGDQERDNNPLKRTAPQWTEPPIRPCSQSPPPTTGRSRQLMSLQHFSRVRKFREKSS